VVVAVGLTARLTAAELSAIGSGALVGSLAGLLGELKDSPADVRNNDLYFLLRLASMHK
jgi:hypothetical protein